MKRATISFWIWLVSLALVFSAPTPALAQDPIGTVEVQAAGPVGTLRCTAGWEFTEVHADLDAGERERLLVPLLGRRQAAGLEPRPALDEPRAGIQVLAETLDWPEPWERLPRLLRSRTYPPVQHNGPQLGQVQWAWLAMSLILVLALRRRPWWGLALGALAAFVLYLWIPAAEVQHPKIVRVLEGDGAGHWLEVRGAHDRLLLERIERGWLARLPAAQEVYIERLADPQGAWAICSEGARLFFSTRIEVPRPPSAADSAGHEFEAVWVRLPGESWTARGAWDGGALPKVDPEASDPPGWLVAGMPQGRGILVGRLRSAGTAPSWMRLLDFE